MKLSAFIKILSQSYLIKFLHDSVVKWPYKSETIILQMVEKLINRIVLRTTTCTQYRPRQRNNLLWKNQIGIECQRWKSKHSSSNRKRVLYRSRAHYGSRGILFRQLRNHLHDVDAIEQLVKWFEKIIISR